MRNTGLSGIDTPPAWQRITRATLLLPLLLLLIVFIARSAVAAPAKEDTDRGMAQVGVIANLAEANSTVDVVSIRLKDNTDKEKLTAIARAIGEKFGATPGQLTFKPGNQDFIQDPGITLDFTLPVVPRGEGYLPIAPFIEALAPYAGKLQMLYIVQGPFTYRGVQEYKHRDVEVTVKPPEKTPESSPVPLAFYGVNAIIKNPSLTSVRMPHYAQDQRTGAGQGIAAMLAGLSLWTKVGIAGIFGAVLGVVLSLLLPRKRLGAPGREDDQTKGGHV